MDEHIKGFETTNVRSNQESTTKKGISKTTKLVLIINAALITITMFVVLIIVVIIPHSKAKAYQKKLDTWVSLLNYEGVSQEELISDTFKNRIEDLHKELGFSFNSEVKNIPMDALREYILTNDFDRILTAAENADFYQYHQAIWVVYETIYELYPEKFQKVVLDKSATSGYYVDNPTANPGVAREVESSNRPGYTDFYKVTHYGDYAVLEETYWVYYDGTLGWVDGNFYDTPGYWKQDTNLAVYYKGYYFDSAYEKSLSKLEDIIFYENDTYVYKFEYYEGHLSDAGAFRKVTD